MALKDLSIATQLRLGLGIILTLVILLGALAWRQTDLLWKQTKDIYDHPLPVSRAITSLEADILGMRLEVRNLLLADAEEERSLAIQNSARYQVDAERQFTILFERYLGPRGDIENAHDTFVQWLAVRTENFELVRAGKRAEAWSRIQDTGNLGLLRLQLVAHIKKIKDYAQVKADRFFLNATELNDALNRQLGLMISGIFLLALILSYLLLRGIKNPLRELTSVADQLREGAFDARSRQRSANEFGTLAGTFNALAETIQAEITFRARAVQLNAVMLRELESHVFGLQVLEPLMQLTDSQVGAIYLLNQEKTSYEHLESIGLDSAGRASFSATTREGEFGSVLATQQIQRLSDIPADTRFTFAAVSGSFLPREIVTIPLLSGDEVPAIISLASLHGYDPVAVRLITDLQATMAAWMNNRLANRRVKALAEDLNHQNCELQTQQEELRVANEELEEQTQRLQQSEEELRSQQEELQVTNEELEEKNDLLERRTREVELARRATEEKAEALALASKYKSEFLANMSHELRTPLNSLLLLAQGLVRNQGGNLNGEQTEAARIIYGSGTDLLNLINEILDLSKIEAGRIELQPGPVPIRDLATTLEDSFRHLAKAKRIGLTLVVREDAPTTVMSDRRRVEQVLRNLIANAVKFTEHGGVTISFGPAEGDGLSVAVSDTGIGIPPELHQMIFEAFQQADGSTSRKFGGTGLGLSISRELARLLGGRIALESAPGRGSTFTLLLPGVLTSALREPIEMIDIPKSNPAPLPPPIPDDRESIVATDRVMLVIEDDPDFARILYGKCHEKGFKCLAAATGEAGLELAAEYLPSAIILDLKLPGIDGWAVLSALKEQTRTRHIPVHIISAEETSSRALKTGAVGHFTKPIALDDLEEAFRRLEKISTGQPKRLLVVDDDMAMRKATVKLVGNGDVTTDEAETGEEALAMLRSHQYDCVVLDLELPDMDGSEVLTRLEEEGVAVPPVIVYTGRDLTPDQETAIRERAESIVIKDVRSPERLLDEVSLFLHRVVSRMAERKRKVIHDLHDTDTHFQGKKVLVVDDDMRTTFAIAHLLTDSGMKPLKAENGERALRLLDEHPETDLVLMDIMMPVMDGYETIRQIRAQARFRSLPIIALTAKAMPEDREKCLEAGASDYLPKPLDQGRLLSMMRVWLCR